MLLTAKLNLMRIQPATELDYAILRLLLLRMQEATTEAWCSAPSTIDARRRAGAPAGCNECKSLTAAFASSCGHGGTARAEDSLRSCRSLGGVSKAERQCLTEGASHLTLPMRQRTQRSEQSRRTFRPDKQQRAYHNTHAKARGVEQARRDNRQ